MGDTGGATARMVRIEKGALLVAFFAVVASLLVGIWYLIGIVPLPLKLPVGVFLVSLVVFGVCRILRHSLDESASAS